MFAKYTLRTKKNIFFLKILGTPNMPLSFSSLNPTTWTGLPNQKTQPNLTNKKNEDQKGVFV
jgi:hypothetical protein